MLGRRLLTVTKATQQACRGMAMKAEVTPAVRRKNIAVAITIVCFVGGVYYHSINKMKQVIRHSFIHYLFISHSFVLTCCVQRVGRVRHARTGGLGRTQKQGINISLIIWISFYCIFIVHTYIIILFYKFVTKIKHSRSFYLLINLIPANFNPELHHLRWNHFSAQKELFLNIDN